MIQHFLIVAISFVIIESGHRFFDLFFLTSKLCAGHPYFPLSFIIEKVATKPPRHFPRLPTSSHKDGNGIKMIQMKLLPEQLPDRRPHQPVPPLWQQVQLLLRRALHPALLSATAFEGLQLSHRPIYNYIALQPRLDRVGGLPWLEPLPDNIKPLLHKVAFC